MGANSILEDAWGSVPACGGDDDLLLAAGDPGEPVVVDLTDISGVEPSVRFERFFGCVRVVPVPGEDLPTIDHHFAVIGDRDRRAEERLPEYRPSETMPAATSLT